MGRQSAIIDASVRGHVRGLVQPDGPGRLVGGVFVLARSAVAVSVTGTLVETTVATATLPGGMLGPNGVLLLYALFSHTASANNKTIRAKVGGLDLFASQQISAAGGLTTNKLRYLHNRNSEAAQICYAGWAEFGINTGVNLTANVDTSVDQSIAITVQLASAPEVIALEAWCLEVMPAD